MRAAFSISPADSFIRPEVLEYIFRFDVEDSKAFSSLADACTYVVLYYLLSSRYYCSVTSGGWKVMEALCVHVYLVRAIRCGYSINP